MHFAQCCGATRLLLKNWNEPIFGEQTGKESVLMFAYVIRLIREWKRYNRGLNELSRLDDRELADIGISRCDIPRVAWNTAHER